MPVKKKVKTKKKSNRFSNIELPSRGGDTEREGKKSVEWRDDPEILQRLVEVAALMNQNQPSPVIAEACGVSVATAKRDISRVRELWKEDANEKIGFSREIGKAQYEAVIRNAWEDIENLKPRQMHLKPQLYATIIRAQHRIDQLSGIGDNVNIGNQNGKPFQVETIEDVRKKRWEEIGTRIGKVVNGENKAPTIN